MKTEANIEEINLTDCFIALTSKREGTLIETITNTSDRDIIDLYATEVTINGARCTVVACDKIKVLKPGESTQINIDVVLPGDIAFEFGPIDVTEAHIVFSCSRRMTQTDYDALPEWR